MTVRQKVQERREDILRLGDKYGATNIRIFGSVARGEERPDSDIDVLLELNPQSLETHCL